MLTFGSLFSGIGGIDLGLERAGMQCRWQSEIDPYASRVLAKHWPDIPNLGDVTKIDWRNVERTDVVAGGYPCQPFSVAGRRQGANDPRHLWPYFRNAICVLRPRYALLENVPGHLSLGFGHVLADLAKLGYDCRWDCIPAASIGAPHRRNRLFAIATDTNQPRSQRRPRTTFQAWPNPKRHVRQGNWWSTEPNVGRMANGIPARVDRLRGLGNAVVPQVAEHVARMIIQDTQ